MKGSKETAGKGTLIDERVSFVLCKQKIVPSVTLLFLTLFEHTTFLCTEVDQIGRNGGIGVDSKV
jgi:hypothetical protein